jgi:hypothetical protein
MIASHRPAAAALLVTAVALLPACTRGPDPAAERAEVERVVKSNIQWALTKDRDLSYGTVDRSPEFFFFTPDSAGTIQGFDAFEKQSDFFMDDRFKAIRSEFRDFYVGLSPRGDAAWFHCFLDDINEWEGRPACWWNVRWTGTLVKRAEGWKIVQMHFSFPEERFARP